MAKKANDMIKKSEADLVQTLGEKRTSLRAFRFGEAGSRSRNVREGRLLRKDIARILTELTSRAQGQGKLASKS